MSYVCLTRTHCGSGYQVVVMCHPLHLLLSAAHPGVPPSEANAEAKMHDIVLRRRLVETAKSQAQEVALLRAELERLRMRTFPALVQVDN